MKRFGSLILVLTACVLPMSSAVHQYYWKGLGYDEDNYLCYHFYDLCNNYLEEIGCSMNSTSMTNLGCPGYPDVFNNITHFKGTCSCKHPISNTAAGTRITNQIISNRIVPDMFWILEPWQSGPPYDFVKSYENVCQLTLDRLGCPRESQTIVAKTSGTYTCTCGTMTTTSTAIQNVIIDQINKLKLTNMPIFANPVYLSVALSLCMVLIVGKLGSIVAVYFGLPGILGYILVGLGMENFLNPMMLKGPGFPFPSTASELKTIALCLVLMRAGLAVDINDIKKSALPTIMIGFLPYLSEFLAFTFTANKLFGWSQIESGLFGAMMSALGPSVVIPPMLNLLANKEKNYGYVPKQVLLSAPLEAVIAVVLFAIFTNLNQTTTDPYYPWVKVLPLYANCLLIPVNIIFSAIVGIIVGYLVSRYINWRVTIANDLDWTRINNNMQMGSSTADLLFVLLVACYTMMSLTNKQYIQQCSGVLCVFVCCGTLSIFCDKKVAQDIATGLKGIWVFAEVFLFTFVGTNLQLEPTNGPLMGQRGMSPSTFKNLIACMLIGTCGRYFGHWLTAACVWPAWPSHRLSLGYFSRFTFSAWTCQLPKATIQATLGGVAYSMAIIPGPQGLNRGLIMLQSSAITILFFAALGTLIVTFIGAPVALQCADIDEAAGWDSAKACYRSSSPYYKPGTPAADDVAKDNDAETEEPGSPNKGHASAVPLEAEMVTLREGQTVYTKSAAGFYVPEVEGRTKRADTFFDLAGRAVQLVSGGGGGGGDDQAGGTGDAEGAAGPRRRSVSQGIKYVLTGADDDGTHQARRPSIEGGRRPSIEQGQARRPSVEQGQGQARRPSIDAEKGNYSQVAQATDAEGGAI